MNFYSSINCSVGRLVAVTLVAGFLGLSSGCGKKDDSSSAAPAPQAVTASAQATETASANGVDVSFKFNSNTKDAKFKCQVEPVRAQGATPAAWADCQEKITVPVGEQLKVTVKAVDSAGKESETPVVLIVPTRVSDVKAEQPAPQTSVQPTVAAEESMQVEIVEKAQIGNEVNQASVQVHFVLHGGIAANYEYECRRDRDLAFGTCTSADGYNFENLADKATATLTVRARNKSTGATTHEDAITFNVKLSIIDGGQALATQKTGNISLGIRLLTGESAVCSIYRGSQLVYKPVYCNQQYNIDLSRLGKGSFKLIVEKRDNAGNKLTSESISFCAQACDAIQANPGTGNNGNAGGVGGVGQGGQGGVGGVGPGIQGPPTMAIGRTYGFTVPNGFHVQQYVNNANPFSQPRLMRINSNSDSAYIGNYSCTSMFDRMVSAPGDGEGRPYDYCETTASESVLKEIMDSRLANNHIQIATSLPVDAAANAPFEVISINQFDSRWDFNFTRSRFMDLCRGAIGGSIQGKDPIRKTYFPVAVAQGFYAAELKTAEFWVCDVVLAAPGPGLGGKPTVYKIGGFMIADQGHSLPDCRCGFETMAPAIKSCGGYSYSNTNLLEVVYITNSQMPDEYFVRQGQDLFLNTLKSNPR